MIFEIWSVIVKFLILGAGGVGGYLGGCLALTGFDVTFVARGAHYESLKNNGLKLVYPQTDRIVSNIKVVDDPQKQLFDKFDVVIHCSKTTDLISALNSVRHVIDSHTQLIFTQNGIDNFERISVEFQDLNIIGGSMQIVSGVERPGVIKIESKIRKLTLGCFSSSGTTRLLEIERIFKISNIDVFTTKEIEKVIWSKFIFINAFSGLTSLLRQNFGYIQKDQTLFQLFRRSMNEVYNLSCALSIGIDPVELERWEELALKLEPSSQSSMLRDLKNGKKLELESLNGIVHKRCQSLNVDSPINSLIYGALLPFVNGGRPDQML
jgi:2-dehydropantoate 2-reductase